MFRVHQFEKVEMFSFVEPSESGAEHERILAIEEEILSELEIPYRVVNIAVNDLGDAPKYDCEVAAGQFFTATTSTSNTTDFQARRLGVRRVADDLPDRVHRSAGGRSRAQSSATEGGRRDDKQHPLPTVSACGAGRLASPSLIVGRRDGGGACVRLSTISNVSSRRVISNTAGRSSFWCDDHPTVGGGRGGAGR